CVDFPLEVQSVQQYILVSNLCPARVEEHLRRRRRSEQDTPVAVPEHASVALLLGAAQDREADGEVENGEPAVPEQDPLIAALPARQPTRNDLAELGVQRRGREPAAVHVTAQRAEPPRLRLPPVVDDYLVHHVEQVNLHRSEEHTSELQSRSDLVCR